MQPRWGLHGGGEPLHPGEQRFSDHPYLARAPGLDRDPLHHVVEIVLLLWPKSWNSPSTDLPLPLMSWCTVHVAPGNEPLDVVGLAKVVDGPLRQVLEVLLVSAGGVESRELPRCIRAEDVASHPHPIAHGDHDVPLHDHLVFGLAQLVRREVLGEHGGHDLGLEDLGVHSLPPCASATDPRAPASRPVGVSSEREPQSGRVLLVDHVLLVGG